MASSSITMRLAAAGAVFAALLGAAPAAGAGPDSGTETAGDEAPATWVPRQVIVRFEPGAGASDRAAARREAGTVPAEGLGLPGLQLLRIRDGESVPETVSELEAEAAVRYAEPNLTYTPAAMPDDPLADQLWGLENTAQGVGGFNGPLLDADIDAAAAWNVESGDEATILAVMDTGVDVRHPDLEPQLWQNPGEVGGEYGVDDDGNGRVDDTSGWDFLNTDSNDDTPDSEDADPSDLHGHGTHVAGTALARAGNAKGITGVAQRGSLMVLRVCAAYDGSCPLADQIEAINYAAAEGAKVLNGSIAGDGVSQAVRDTLNAHPEMLFVFAAGNDAKDVDAEPQGPCQADQVGSGGYTAGNVICVTATDQADRLAGFSNFGASGVDLAAPGTQIMSSSARRVMFSDDFETDELTTRWTASGGSSWDRTDEAPLETFGASDSPGGDYAPNTVATLTSEAIPMQPGYSSCRLNYYRSTVLGAGDRFDIEVLLDGLVKESISFAGPQASERRTFISLNPAFDAGGAVRIRFRVTADGSNQADGVHMDDVSLVCSGPPSDGAYEFRQGTSMAAPHVSGAAALIFSRDPDATPAQVKSLLLNTTDPLATLAGKTVTGGRLNAGRALASTPADTTITGGTAGDGETIATRHASFTYASTENDPSYQCSLDGAPFGACSAQTPLLANGTHTFRVRTVDPRGNIEGTPAIRTFTVDSPANGMQIDSGPGEGAHTSDRTPSFTFSSTAADATFLCAVEPGAVRGPAPLAPCTSAAGHTTSPLADGIWTLWVEARDADDNVGGDASRTFHVDATAPDTVLTGRPPAVGGPNPAFVFSSPEQGAGFQCRLDAEPSGAWSPCTSPTAFNGLADGDHVFAVRAVDSLGNADGSPATASFRVDTVAPAVGITQGPAGLTNDTTPTFGFGPEAGSTVTCSLDRGTAVFSACASAAQHTPPAPLRDGAWVFRVRATDAAGNTQVATRAFTLDATAPQTMIQRRPRPAMKIRTSRRRVTFSFSATEAASFRCAVDSAPMRPCARRISRTLRAGRHRIRVVAVDRAANRDATPAVYRFRLQRAR